MPRKRTSQQKAPSSLSEWIYELLDVGAMLYVEPFGSLLGVAPKIAATTPVNVINDIDGHISAWWPMLMHSHDELTEALKLCQYKTGTYSLATKHLNQGVSTLGFFNVSVLHSVLLLREIYGSDVDSILIQRRINTLKQIYSNINIVRYSPLQLLEDSMDCNDVMVFCDWPYYVACQKRLQSYCQAPSKKFQNQLSEVMEAHQGKIAIAAYAKDWDHFLTGWQKTPTAIRSHAVGHRRITPESAKGMYLWTNYEAARKKDGHLPQLFNPGL